MYKADILNVLIWVIKSIASVVAGIVFALSISFFLIHAMPGNPYLIMLQNLIQQGIPYEQAKLEAIP